MSKIILYYTHLYSVEVPRLHMGFMICLLLLPQCLWVSGFQHEPWTFQGRFCIGATRPFKGNIRANVTTSVEVARSVPFVIIRLALSAFRREALKFGPGSRPTRGHQWLCRFFSTGPESVQSLCCQLINISWLTLLAHHLTRYREF